MRLQLKKLQKENAALAQKVQAGRETITDTEQRIASSVEEWRVRETPYTHMFSLTHISTNLTLVIFYLQTSLQDLEAFVLTLSPSESF